MNGGAAIFVKTPGRSPVKTRLAASLGAARAATLHRAGADAVAAVLAAAHARLCAYYAVAEPDVADHWTGLPQLAQGEGGLGERLARVHASLLARHRFALMLGADAPQVTPAHIHAAAAWLDTDAPRIAFGSARDGGFWLFGANFPIEAELWTGVPYSAKSTGRRLLAALAGRGELQRLPILVDLDTPGDLQPVAAALAALREPLPQQAAMLRAVREALAAHGVPALAANGAEP